MSGSKVPYDEIACALCTKERIFIMEHKRPPLQKEITSQKIGEGLYCLSSPPVGFKQYLFLGSEKALLVDTGMGIGSLRTVIETITDLPVTVINTHGHPDHAGGNSEFEDTWINPADFDVFEKMASIEFRREDVSHMPGEVDWATLLLPTPPLPKALTDGQTFDLGGRVLSVIFTPGHTHGSLCVYEEATGILVTGDNVQANTTALREWNSATVEDLYESLLKLSKRNVKRLLAGHAPNDNPADLLDRKIACAKKILDGATGEPHEFRGNTTYLFESDGTSIEYMEHHIHSGS